MFEKNKIYLGDCLELIKDIPDESIDCVITDPPYCVGSTSNGLKANHTDNYIIKPFFKSLLEEFKRVLKPTGQYYINTDWRTYPIMYDVIMSVMPLKNLIVWDYDWIKTGNYYRYRHEFIMYGCKNPKQKRTFGGGEPDVWRIKPVNPSRPRFHAAQKPLELIEKMIINSTNENDFILDTFLGSGSTVIAAMKTNRNFIGFELNEDTYKIADQRIEDNKSKGK